jgi:hypothetical protein
MQTVMSKTADLKAQWKQNKAQWEKLCTEQEGLPREGFAKVFEVLDRLEETFTPQHPYTENYTLIDQALMETGHATDEAFCTAFKRNNAIMIEGNRLMVENATINLAIESENRPPEYISPEGWQFYKIHILAPTEYHKAINDEIARQALTGKGFFENTTNVSELPNEALDEYLGVEAYGVVCSYVHYLRELRQYQVTGALLGNDFTNSLFQILKDIADFIKANTDKPQAIEKHILDVMKLFDSVPVWGLIFQILILQGLLSLLENCTLKQGDNGFIEAQDLCNWIAELQLHKVLNFAMVGALYSDEDKTRLKPLCDYLYNTEIGRAVQDELFKRKQPDVLPAQPDRAGNITEASLPSELDTERARKYFARAVEVGYMTPTGTGYKWKFGGERGCLARLGYFVERVYCPTNTEQLPEQSINKLFVVNRIASAITQLHNAKKPQKWRAEIDDKIFFD